jgi:hypothetical protein
MIPMTIALFGCVMRSDRHTVCRQMVQLSDMKVSATWENELRKSG